MPETRVADDAPEGNDLDLSVVLPSHDEEAAIASVIGEIRAALKNWPGRWEILIVDDASTDATFARAQAEDVRIVRHVERRGSGAARKTGIRAARGAIVAMLDADGSYDPAQLPELLRWYPGYDQVNGARDVERGDVKWLRAPAKWAIRKLAEFISGKTIPDLNTGMKAF